MTMLKICRCGKHIPMAEGLCNECKAKQEQYTKDRYKKYQHNRTDKEAQSFYNSKAWKIVKDRIKTRDNGICKMCWNRNRLRFMNTVHHIIPLEDSKSLALVDSNLICLCEQCHQKVHIEYDKGNKSQMQMTLRDMIKG